MFWSDRQRRGQPDEWGDLQIFAEAVEASLELIDPAPSFRWELRERLIDAAAAELADREAVAQPWTPIGRGVLVGAGAAAAAAAAGAMLVYWRRNHPEGFGQLLHARGA